MKYRVWHITQIPMTPFYVEVDTIQEGVKLMNVLADYDLFQFENGVRPDYSNMSGIRQFKDGEWLDFFDDETGIDNPQEYLDYIESLNTKD